LENIAIELAVYEDVWPKLKEENSADNESEEQDANLLFINQACFVVAALNQHALDSAIESQFIKALINQFELFIACAVDGHSKRIANNIAIWMKCYIEKALKHNEINDYYLSIYDNLNLDSIACDREKEFSLACFYDYMYSDPAIRELHVLFKFMYLPNLLHRIYLMSEEEDLNEDDKKEVGVLIRRIETLSSPISLDMALYMNFVELLSKKNDRTHQLDLIWQTLSLFLKFLKDDSKLNYDCWERFSLIMCYFFEKNDLVNIATPRQLYELNKTLMEVNVLSSIESYEKMRQHLSCYFVENKTTNKKSKKKKKKAKTPKQMLSIELPEAVEIKPDPELDGNQCAKFGSTEEEAPVKSEVEIGANANHKDIEFPHTARNLFEFLKEKYKFYVYGGYIRDTLLEIKPDADIDIVISMPVEELGNLMCEFMAKYNIEIHSAGFCEYVPTLYILKINKPYKISFDIRAVENLDLSKEYLNCDFYINAIFYDPVRKEVKDPSSQGLQDVYDKKLRIIERKSDENPSKLSLQFNAKRLFRILTHQLKYDLKPDPILGWYFKAHAKDVTHLDADGIRLMLSKTLLFNDVISNFNFLLTSPLGDCLFPGFRMVLEKFPDYNHWFYSQLLSIKQVMRVGMRASIDDVLACVMVGYFQAGKVHQKAPGFFPAKVEPMILPSDMTNISCRSAYVVGLTNNFYNFSRKLRKQFAVQKH
ncbi:MAG: hypothetical protein KDH94_00945, partial [Coxiellaceae bacterium]|nr:hypothetical protein [Coxiellaceae bacterium]